MNLLCFGVFLIADSSFFKLVLLVFLDFFKSILISPTAILVNRFYAFSYFDLISFTDRYLAKSLN